MSGLVYVSCGYGAHVVEVREPRMGYRLLQTLGRGDGKEGNGVGEFYLPTGLCVDDVNVLMVVDQFNHRVQFFD